MAKKSKKHPKCEDAFFISESGFGVSDGVSGWNSYGFSSDEFSKQLMNFAKVNLEKIEQLRESQPELKDPECDKTSCSLILNHQRMQLRKVKSLNQLNQILHARKPVSKQELAKIES